MSSLPKLFFALLLASLIIVPAFAESVGQGNGAAVSGTNNSVFQHNEVHTDVARQYNDIKAPTYISITNEAPVDTTPYVSMLGIGDAESTFMMYPNETLSYPARDNTTYLIRSANPIAVYVIATGRDRTLLNDIDSKLEYDPIYHRFDHGVVSPVWIWPHFTTKCSFSTSGVGYVVLDNRYFPDYAMVEVIPVPTE